MNNNIKAILTLILLASLFCYLGGDTFCYFIDSEVSTGNSFTAGVWDVDQSQYLDINTTEAKLTGKPASQLLNVYLRNTGTGNITIKKIYVWWNGTGNVTKIILGASTFWTGNAIEPNTFNGTYEMQPSVRDQTHFQLDLITLEGDKTFHLIFWMNDDSSKDSGYFTVTWTGGG